MFCSDSCFIFLAIVGEGDETGSEFTGRLIISNGTVFTEELLNKNSSQFKALAYDTEQKVQYISHLFQNYYSWKV